MEEQQSGKPKGQQAGGDLGIGRQLVFVVQRHEATHLHFDFRLQVEGLLKSWAVPKGPSMNPADKRLAIMVDDHPLNYAEFEGTIPEGEYGAGTVERWDYGAWSPIAGDGPGSSDVNRMLKLGKLEFFLDGNKLRGAFTLVRTNFKGTKNSWLLKKKDDDYAVGEVYNAADIPSH